MKFRTRIVWIFLLSPFLLLTSALGAEKVRYAIPSRSVSTLPVFVAFKEGYFRDEGMEVEIINMSSQMAMTATLAGSVDFSSTPGSVMNAAVRGLDLKVVFVIGQKPLHDLMVHGGIRSFPELKGKILGIDTFGSMSDFLIRKILRKNGLEPDRDVGLRTVGTDNLRLAALKTKIVAGAMMTVPYNFLAQRDGFRRLAYAGDYEEVLIGGVVTTGKLLRENPEKVFRFLRASLKGHRFYRERKLSAVRHMSEYLKIPDSQFLSEIYDYHRATLTQTGVISPTLMTRVIEDARQFTKVEREVKADEVFDFSLTEKAVEETKNSP